MNSKTLNRMAQQDLYATRRQAKKENNEQLQNRIRGRWLLARETGDSNSMQKLEDEYNNLELKINKSKRR